MQIVPFVPVFFVPEASLPEGFKYPTDYVSFCSAQGHIWRKNTWSFFDFRFLMVRFEGLKKRYPTRVLVPFARAGGNDDVACFELNQSSMTTSIVLVHDFASPGWEDRGHFNSLSDWFALVDEQEEEWLRV